MPTVTAERLLECEPLLERFVNLLVDEHDCHTVLLYGSRALGTAKPDSDYDMLGIREGGEPSRDARIIDGFFLDAFLYPEKNVENAGASFLHLRGGVALRDPRGLGARLLADVAVALQAPPPEPAATDVATRRTWCKKMLTRIAAAGPDDVEAHYRRVWLLFDVLEFYFVLRRRHYLGPKESFRWLAEHDENAHRAFAMALAPGAPVADIETLVDVVLGA